MKRLLVPALAAIALGGCAAYAGPDYTYGYNYGTGEYYADPYYGYYEAPAVTVFPSVTVGGYWRDGSYWRDGRAWPDERHWREPNGGRDSNRWRDERRDVERADRGAYGTPQRNLQRYPPGAYEPGREGWTSDGAERTGR